MTAEFQEPCFIKTYQFDIFDREQRKRLSAGGGAGPGIPELSEQQEAKQGPRPVENRLSDSHVIAAAASALQQKEQQEGSKDVSDCGLSIII